MKWTSWKKRKFFKRRESKQRENSIERILTKERADITNRMQWTYALLLNSIETKYGLVAYHIKKRYNTALYLASMRSCYYFDRPKDLGFHDLRTEIEPPPKPTIITGHRIEIIPSPTIDLQ